MSGAAVRRRLPLQIEVLSAWKKWTYCLITGRPRAWVNVQKLWLGVRRTQGASQRRSCQGVNGDSAAFGEVSVSQSSCGKRSSPHCRWGKRSCRGDRQRSKNPRHYRLKKRIGDRDLKKRRIEGAPFERTPGDPVREWKLVAELGETATLEALGAKYAPPEPRSREG